MGQSPAGHACDPRGDEVPQNARCRSLCNPQVQLELVSALQPSAGSGLGDASLPRWPGGDVLSGWHVLAEA